MQLVYDGMHMNIASLGGNPHFLLAIMGVIEFPSYFLSWWAMDKYGRRWFSVMNMFIAAIGCILVAFTPHEGQLSNIYEY
jgi:hypothetical protein